MSEVPVSAPQPVIVLVRPQLGENIGKAARAMLNFGLRELRLVAPRDGWPNPGAGPAASGADVVLAEARVFSSVADAVADCGHVYATTVRKRGVTKPVVTPEEAAAAVRGAPERSAILFGPERSGLDTDDVALARAIVTVPINPEFGSLNLAQAVMVMAYEWWTAADATPPRALVTHATEVAAKGSLDRFLTHLVDQLDACGFLRNAPKRPGMVRNLRHLFERGEVTEQELRTLHGVVTELAIGRRVRGRLEPDMIDPASSE